MLYSQKKIYIAWFTSLLTYISKEVLHHVCAKVYEILTDKFLLNISWFTFFQILFIANQAKKEN